MEFKIEYFPKRGVGQQVCKVTADGHAISGLEIQMWNFVARAIYGPTEGCTNAAH